MQNDYTMVFPGEWIITVHMDSRCECLYQGKRYTCNWYAVQLIKAALYKKPSLWAIIT